MTSPSGLRNSRNLCATDEISSLKSSALAFAMMMEFARDDWRAADYGLQASLFTFGRIAVAPPAGLLLDRLGYPGMLAALAVAALAVALLISANRQFE